MRYLIEDQLCLPQIEFISVEEVQMGFSGGFEGQMDATPKNRLVFSLSETNNCGACKKNRSLMIFLINLSMMVPEQRHQLL